MLKYIIVIKQNCIFLQNHKFSKIWPLDCVYRKDTYTKGFLVMNYLYIAEIIVQNRLKIAISTF